MGVSTLAGIRGKGVVMGRDDATSPPLGLWDEAADHFRRWRSGDPGGLDDTG